MLVWAANADELVPEEGFEELIDVLVELGVVFGEGLLATEATGPSSARGIPSTITLSPPPPAGEGISAMVCAENVDDAVSEMAAVDTSKLNVWDAMTII